jgi:uncharacterized membrane protein YraQ (UPF0718 family)
MNYLLKDKRLLLLSMMTMVTAILFWSISRYPGLYGKMLHASGFVFADVLSFDAILDTRDAHSWFEKTWTTFVNWINTNKKGMAFGIGFGALLITFFQLLEDKILAAQKAGSRNFIAVIYGFIMGVPLGLCTNCATPIAYGIYAKGAKLETALAVQMSSPTMNVVVLITLFNLFSTELFIGKIVLTLGVIFILMPFLVSRFPAERLAKVDNIKAVNPAVKACSITDHSNANFVTALQFVVQNVLKNLGFLIVRVVPLMLLAGFLGAVLIHLLPWDTVINSLPKTFGLPMVLAMVGLGLFGLFLPVPMAFDVIFVGGLAAAGLPAHYAFVLLFTLGIFSIYPFMMMIKARAVKSVLMLSLGILAVSTVASLIIYLLQ